MSVFWTSPAWSWPLLLVVAAGAVYLTVVLYGRSRPRPPRNVRRTLVLLRSSVFLLLLLAAAGPVVVRFFQHQVPGQLVFVLEDSGSMNLSEQDAGPSRWDQGLQVVARVDSALQSRSFSPEMRLLRGNGQDDLREFRLADPVIPTPKAQGTSFARLFSFLALRLVGDPVRALVLLSDGQESVARQEAGPQQGDLFQGASTARLFLGGLGDPVGGTDRLLKDLRYPETAFAGDQVTIQATVLDRFAQAGVSGSFTLRLKNGSRILKEVVVEGTGRATNTELSYIPDQPGLQILELEVSALDNERHLENNQVSLGIDVRPSRSRVLVLAPRPGWEVRFLSQVAEGENRLGMEIVHQTARGLAFVDSLTPFQVPETLADWKAFKAVVLDGWQPMIPGLDYELLAQAVRAGLGLLILPGQQEGSSGVVSPPEPALAELLPATVQPGPWQRGLFFLAPDSLGREHPVLASVVTSGRPNPFLGLPPVPALAPLHPVQGSRVLVRAQRRAQGHDPGYPLLVVSKKQAGRVALWGGQRPWRQIFREPVRASGGTVAGNPVKMMLGNLLVWLADGTEDTGLFFAGRPSLFQEGQRIHLAARWLDLRGQPVDNGQLEILIQPLAEKASRGEARTFSSTGFDPLTQQYGFDLPALPPGRYTAQLSAPGEPDLPGPREDLFILGHSLEETQVRQDARKLFQLAQVQGGSYIDLNQPTGWRQLVDQLAGLDWKPARVQDRRRRDLTSGWPFLALVVLLLAGEWFLRRRHGLL